MSINNSENAVPHRAPRKSARSALLYVLGDLVHPSPAPVPTAAFIQVLSYAGYEHHAARQAIARCAKAGWISSSRHGRHTWWTITDAGHRLIDDGLQRIAALGEAPPSWDRRWIVVITSIPQNKRIVRERLYRYLSWSGFGNPALGTWVSPWASPQRDRSRSAKFAIAQFGLADTTLSFTGTANDIGIDEQRIVEHAWRLKDLNIHYREQIEKFSRYAPSSGQESIQAVLELDDILQRLPLLDPQLPRELAPDNSTRTSANELLRLRDMWLVPARARLNQLANESIRRFGAVPADSSAQPRHIIQTRHG